MLENLNKIVDWMEKLQTLDTTGVDPLLNISSEHNILREDVPKPSMPHNSVLANAPKKRF